ncbi:hypothetical protein FN846DRAFT_904580 [Sphaerosporella brunnea]|uniref:Uncharacterized protein n=1 Tax=Sphaerosporella brunnea TaxID=1250544 RepID=A0A5J5F450_9PEZI|nr:hypothetical protein FN846DRAFT_904580 [Sphaerosporella brunnea]
MSPLSILLLPLPLLVFLTSPLTLLLRLLSQTLRLMITLPLTLLQSLQSLYIYLGSALLIGALAGGALALCTHCLCSVFGLLPSAEPTPSPEPTPEPTPSPEPSPPRRSQKRRVRPRRPAVGTIIEDSDESLAAKGWYERGYHSHSSTEGEST